MTEEDSKNSDKDRYTFSLEGKQLKLDSATDVAEYVRQIEGKAVGEIRDLRLSGNTIGVAAAKALSEALGKHSAELCSANLSDVFTGRLKEEIPLAIESFGTHFLTNLTELDLSDNAFGPAGAIPLSRFLGKAERLRSLRLQNNGLGPAGGCKIAEALTTLAQGAPINESTTSPKTRLTTLVIGRNRLENDGAAALGAALKLFRESLRELVLPQNGIRPDGIAALINNGLLECRQLTRLDFQDNTFTDKGSEALAKGLLQSWKKLAVLNVGDCLLGKTGSIVVVSALRDMAIGTETGNLGAKTKPTQSDEKANENAEDSKSNSLPPLSILNLQFNEMDERGAGILAQALPKMTSLTSLFLNGNSFDPEGVAAEAIRNNLKHNQMEHILDEWDEMEFDEDEEDSDEETAERPIAVSAPSTDDLSKAMKQLSVNKE